MDKEEVVKLIRDRLGSYHPGGATLEITGNAIEQDNGYWYVPIRPSIQPTRTFEYYDALAEIETDLSLNEHLKVLLLPTLPD